VLCLIGAVIGLLIVLAYWNQQQLPFIMIFIRPLISILLWYWLLW
jgi:hypothetical protein